MAVNSENTVPAIALKFEDASHTSVLHAHTAHILYVYFAMASPPPPAEFNGDSFILHAVLYRERFQQPLMQAKLGLDFH